jgi:hypothetical protein
MFWIITLLMLGFILVNVLQLFLFAQPASAALPPLSLETLELEAMYVLTGVANDVQHQVVNAAAGSNQQFVATVEVLAVEKGLLLSTDPNQMIDYPPGTPLPGCEIAVYYWQVGDRPPGWTGDSGQSRGLPLNTPVRLYVSQEENQLWLLSPNGWNPLN